MDLSHNMGKAMAPNIPDVRIDPMPIKHEPYTLLASEPEVEKFDMSQPSLSPEDKPPPLILLQMDRETSFDINVSVLGIFIIQFVD